MNDGRYDNKRQSYCSDYRQFHAVKSCLQESGDAIRKWNGVTGRLSVGLVHA